MESERAIIPFVFGFAKELQALVSKIPKDKIIVFHGNYFSYGPDPLGVAKFIHELRHLRQVELYSDLHERLLGIQVGLIKGDLHEKPEWVSPFYGVWTVIEALGFCPWNLVQQKDCKVLPSIHSRIDQFHVMSPLLAPIAFKEVTLRGYFQKWTELEYLGAYNEDGELLCKSELPPNYYSSEFLPKTYSSLEQKIYGNSLYPAEHSEVGL